MKEISPLSEEVLKKFIRDTTDLQTLNNYLSQPLSNKKKLKFIREIISSSGKSLTQDNYAQYNSWLLDILEMLTLKNPIKGDNNAYFTHHDNIRDLVISLLKSAESDLKICMYTISDNPIAETIAGCHKMGIKVRIITDDMKTFDKGSDIYSLHKSGIQVKIDSYKSLMHHKFLIVDNRKLLTGSYNWTRTGSDINNENILVTTKKRIVKAYDEEFERLWKEMKPLPY